MAKFGPRVKYEPLNELDWTTLEGLSWRAEQRALLKKLRHGPAVVDRYSTLWSNINLRLIELQLAYRIHQRLLGRSSKEMRVYIERPIKT